MISEVDLDGDGMISFVRACASLSRSVRLARAG
jgi:hypothetical protein